MFDDLPAALGCLAVLCAIAGAIVFKVIEFLLEHLHWH